MEYETNFSPSVETISRSNSSDSLENVVRTLFVESHGLDEFVHRELGDFLDRTKDSNYEASTASSDMTVVAAMNLTGGRPEDAAMDRSSTIAEMEDQCSSPKSVKGQFQLKEDENMAMEEPEVSLPSCSALSLTPKQLADIFFAFEAKHLWPGRRKEENSVTTPADLTLTEVQEESVEIPYEDSKENQLSQTYSNLVKASDIYTNAEARQPLKATPLNTRSTARLKPDKHAKQSTPAKKLVKVDASSIVKLKESLENLRQMSSKKDIELKNLRRELMATRISLVNVAKERDANAKRHIDMEETIGVLKEEISKQSLLRNEYEEMKAAQQKIESQAAETVENLKVENQQLCSEVEELKEQLELIQATPVVDDVIDVESFPFMEERDPVPKDDGATDAQDNASMSSGCAQLHEESAKNECLEPHGNRGVDDLANMLLDISARLAALEQNQSRSMLDGSQDSAEQSSASGDHSRQEWTESYIEEKDLSLLVEREGQKNHSFVSDSIEVPYSKSTHAQDSNKVHVSESESNGGWCCDIGCNP